MAPLRCICAAALVLFCQLAAVSGVPSECAFCSPTTQFEPLIAATAQVAKGTLTLSHDDKTEQQVGCSEIWDERVSDSQHEYVGCRAGDNRLVNGFGRLHRGVERASDSEGDDGLLGQPMEGRQLLARLRALEAMRLDQEQYVLQLGRSLEAQRGQILELMAEINGQDCLCPCRQLSERQKQKPQSAAGEVDPLVEEQEDTPPESVTDPLDVPGGMLLSAVEGLVAFDAPEVATGLVGYQERLVVHPRVAWGDHFGLLAAVQVGAEVTALHTLPQESEDGLSQYVAVGDSNGNLHIFHTNGQLAWELSTAVRSPIRSIVSYSKGPLETWLVTGHADGSLLLHSLTEPDPSGLVGGSQGPDLDTNESNYYEGPRIVSHGSLIDRWVGETGHLEDARGASDFENRSLAQGAGSAGPVLALEWMQLGRTDLLLAADSKGTLEIFDVARHKRLAILHKRSRILAFQQPLSSSRVVFVSRSGVGRVDLTGMIVHPVECPGLDGLTLDRFVFDAGSKSKGYGIVEGGKEMVVVNIGGSGDVVSCELVARKKGAFDGAASLHAIKGYLLARSETGADVFNTSVPRFGARNVAGPRPVFTIPSAEIIGAFNWEQADSPSEPLDFPPAVATNKDRLVVLSFPGGLVAMYRSELPNFRPPNLAANWLSSPIFVGIILVVATWQIMIRRPTKNGGAFSAEGLGKWTESDLREFVREHVNGGAREKPPGGDSPGRVPRGLDRTSSRALSRGSGSWRESPSSSREASLDRNRSRERSLERRPEDAKASVNAPPRDVHVDSVRVAGEKENFARPPVPQAACARKEETGRNVLGNLRLGATGVNGQVELIRTMSLQLPPRPETEPPLARSTSLSSTPGAQQRAASIHTDLDAFLQQAGFVEFCGTQTMSRTASLKSEASADLFPGIDTAGPLPGKSVGCVNAPEGGNMQGRFLGGGESRPAGEQAGGIPHFVAEDMVGETGAPESVLGGGVRFLGSMRGGGRKLASTVSAEARDVNRILEGNHPQNRLFDQPRSW